MVYKWFNCMFVNDWVRSCTKERAYEAHIVLLAHSPLMIGLIESLGSLPSLLITPKERWSSTNACRQVQRSTDNILCRSPPLRISNPTCQSHWCKIHDPQSLSCERSSFLMMKSFSAHQLRNTTLLHANPDIKLFWYQ